LIRDGAHNCLQLEEIILSQLPVSKKPVIKTWFKYHEDVLKFEQISQISVCKKGKPFKSTADTPGCQWEWLPTLSSSRYNIACTMVHMAFQSYIKNIHSTKHVQPNTSRTSIINLVTNLYSPAGSTILNKVRLFPSIGYKAHCW
jgi:hypothetical protein